MKIDVITLFPELVQAVIHSGITAKAHKNSLFSLSVWNPRDYVHDVHKTVDDRPFGGGPGMVMKYQPLKDCLDHLSSLQNNRGKRIYLSPQGKQLTQPMAQALMNEKHLVLLCGRYEGVDQRLIDTEIDEEISIGDYILSGGELAAMVLIDAIVRLIPGALNHQLSSVEESFSHQYEAHSVLLDYPHYTRPEIVNDLAVPSILLSGDHRKIKEWRLNQAYQTTLKRRPDLLTIKRELK